MLETDPDLNEKSNRHCRGQRTEQYKKEKAGQSRIEKKMKTKETGKDGKSEAERLKQTKTEKPRRRD